MSMGLCMCVVVCLTMLLFCNLGFIEQEHLIVDVHCMMILLHSQFVYSCQYNNLWLALVRGLY